MKINFVVPEITRTGGIRTVFELANRLTLRGHDVILYAPGIPFNPYKGMIVPYYIRYRMNYLKDYLLGKKSSSANIFNRKFPVKFVPLIRNTFIRNADISTATSWTTSFAVNRLSRSKGKKLYFIQDYEIWFSNKKLADKSYTLPFNRIVVSAYLKDLLMDRFGSDSTEILIGINYDIFKNPDKKFSGKKSILFMDHMLENKNAEGAIKTVVELKEKYPELTIRCFGIDKYHNMPEYVEFFKNPDDRTIVELYRNSDIFIFSSKYEGFGATPAEAMACKCAVVANAIAAIPEYAVNGETAILTDPGKPEDLYRGVSYLLENESELQRISFAGYEHVRKILDWEKALDKFEEVLNKAK
jgi:glycosyltransferase involved in cell wall biosynthesis